MYKLVFQTSKIANTTFGILNKRTFSVIPQKNVKTLSYKPVTQNKAIQRSTHHEIGKPPKFSADLYQKHYQEYSSWALLFTLPTTLLFPLPSMLSVPIDVFLSLAIPAHAVLGLRLVIDDYVPTAGGKSISKLLLSVLAVVVAGGLLTLSTIGDGIGGSIRRIWAPAPTKSIHDQ